jgi:hypothetical protein
MVASSLAKMQIENPDDAIGHRVPLKGGVADVKAFKNKF